MIPYGKQEITESDITAVINILKSDWLTQGPAVTMFENILAEKVNAKYAVAVNSATSALHIACLALELAPGDILWTSPITFVASANAGLYCGAKIDFVDIDPETYNMCPKALALKLEQAEKLNALPKIVVPVHFAGQSCDMASIYELAQRYGFKIIEDASHAIGGKYKKDLIGNCRYSDITVFSFHPVKIITTGEGGLAVTNQEALYERMQHLRSHGITRDKKQMHQPDTGAWYYEQLSLGFNYRMTDIQAALGSSQAERLESYVHKRHEIAEIYNYELKNVPVILPFQKNDIYSAYHLYVIQIDTQSTSNDRNHVFAQLREANIGVNVHYIPVHTQPYYQKLGFSVGDFPVSEQYYRNAISLPMFSSLTHDDQYRVIKILKENLL